MAYEWRWDCKCGEFFYDKWHYNLYEGNGFLIAIAEWTDEETKTEKYQVAWAFVDKQHAKRCLGLEKGSEDMFEGIVDKIILYTDKCHHWKDIVELFTKTQPNITIEIHPTAPKEAEK